MEELFPGLFLRVLNALLRYSVLEMGIDPTLGDRLPIVHHCLDKCVARKSTIVGMVVPDDDALLYGVSFESAFSIDCFR